MSLESLSVQQFTVEVGHLTPIRTLEVATLLSTLSQMLSGSTEVRDQLLGKIKTAVSETQAEQVDDQQQADFVDRTHS